MKKPVVILPPTTIVNETTYSPPRYTYVPPKYVPPPKNQDYFALVFSNQVYTYKNETCKDGKSVSLPGGAFKFFSWDSYWGFGMNFNGHSKKDINFFDQNNVYHEGKFKWFTAGSTLFLRFPKTNVSPYIGFGPNMHVMTFMENQDPTAYSSYNSVLMMNNQMQENKITETRIGGHFDIGIDFYLWNKVILDVGFRNYSLSYSDKPLFSYFKTFTTFYFNAGIMF